MTLQRQNGEKEAVKTSMPWGVYAVFILFISSCYLLLYPIIALDTDIWYHLNAGRYILTSLSIPQSSYFSFIEPARPFIDYYWLFQAIVFKLFTFGGYYALIGLRVTIYAATTLLILRFLLKGQTPSKLLALFATIGVCCALILITRFVLVRPHIFTYLFMVIFLVILEDHPKKVIYLPLLGILWTNIHGVTYPLMVLIVVAYFVEYFYNRIRGDQSSVAEEKRLLIPLALTLITIYISPHGLRLLSVPFTSTGFASDYIQELVPLNFSDLWSWHINNLSPSTMTLSSIIVILALLGIVVGISNRKLRLSHLLLCLGGLFLPTKGVRFLVEAMILALPLIRSNPVVTNMRLAKPVPRPVYLILSGVLMFMPLKSLQALFPTRPSYPLAHQRLPQGVVSFLKLVDTGGKVLNFPNSGGYLQWELYPDYKIFMDMEIPFLFKDEDMYLAKHVYKDKDILEQFINDYDPEYIMAPIYAHTYPDLISEFPEYVKVFFDQSEVIYVDCDRYPEIAEQYFMEYTDPYMLHSKGVGGYIDKLEDDELLNVMNEVRVMIDVHPEGVYLNHIIAYVYNNQGAYDRSLVYTERMIKSHPESPIGYILKGDALKGLNQYSDAILAYKKAEGRSAGGMTFDIRRKLGLTYFAIENYRKAYSYFKKGIDVFYPDVEKEDVYKMGVAGLRSGETVEGQAALTFLYKFRITDEDEVLKADLELIFDELGIDPSNF